MTTLETLYRFAVNELLKNGVENGADEARWLLEELAGFTRSSIITGGNLPVSAEKEELVRNAVKERTDGRPLQYILGTAPFYGFDYYCGEGVLIPRPETEMLVDLACNCLKGKSGLKVLDLCAGSGCIGLTVARLNPSSEVWLVEKSREALEYLEKNLKASGVKNAHIVEYDLFSGFNADIFPKYNVLLSNPPYIASCEMAALQSEVRHEPLLALDGGEDGLDFYRAIESAWLGAALPGAFAAFECGEEQTQSIALLLADKCTDVRCYNDFNSLPRVVSAVVKG